LQVKEHFNAVSYKKTHKILIRRYFNLKYLKFELYIIIQDNFLSHFDTRRSVISDGNYFEKA